MSEARKVPLYQAIAGALIARENCTVTANSEWFDKHTERIEKLVSDHMPSGSGFDNGTKFDMERSEPEKLIFTTSYHHMNEVGMYDGWTDHQVIVTPSLYFGFQLRITGRGRNGFKQYAHELFHSLLSMEVEG